MSVQNIPPLPRGIGADNEQILRARQPLMSRSGRQYCYVPGLKIEVPPLLPAELHANGAFRDPKGFVGGGVIVMKIVDPVAPMRQPAVSQEKALDCIRRVFAIKDKSVSIDNDGQKRIIRNLAVIRKKYRQRLGAVRHGS
jgi:hypothetical protein